MINKQRLYLSFVGLWCATGEGGVSAPVKTSGDSAISPTGSSGPVIEKGRYEPGVHTINNANPYQGVTVTEGHGKYPVIF